MRLMWFRNDLRLRDNPALYNAACEQQGVVAAVTLTPDQWRQHDDAPARLAFWWDNLVLLAKQLAELNINLKVLQLRSFDDCAPALLALAQQYKVQSLHFNREWPLNERRRDDQVESLFLQHGIKCDAQSSGDLVIAPGRVRTKQGGPFRVFTPFAREWRVQLLKHFPVFTPPPLPQPVCVSEFDKEPVTELFKQWGYRQDLWPAGESAAGDRLDRFIETKAVDYKELRDYPALESTSCLSPYLAVGALSPRQCLLALQRNCVDDSWLSSSWLNELVWREFYRHLIVDFPEISQGKPFRPDVESRISWRNEQALFEAWCRGETGFDLIDAAMQQLLQTGWMHNRLRMLTASFLTKLLRVDWRSGEQFFMSHLIDGDFASNRGGWQWSASVGADAAPYFRIFNPERQQQKFDPQLAFVQRWLPDQNNRPAPVIDYAQARREALADYAGEA